jgi:uncharacterized membrane protein
VALFSSYSAETLLLLVACVCACLVRPWRLLAFDARYDLLTPTLVLAVVLPLLWWWPGREISLLLGLVGANVALLTLGWPLAMLLVAYTAAWGVLEGAASWGPAAAAAFWQGVLPLTLAMLGGALLRRLGATNLFGYLLVRGFLIPLIATFAAAWAAHAFTGKFGELGAHANPALFLTALLDAMFTGMLITMLVMYRPRWLATWSERIYLKGRSAAAA